MFELVIIGSSIMKFIDAKTTHHTTIPDLTNHQSADPLTTSIQDSHNKEVLELVIIGSSIKKFIDTRTTHHTTLLDLTNHQSADP